VPKYDKSTTELIKDFFNNIGLQNEKTFKRQELYTWFDKNYPELKRGTLYLNLARLAVNASNRKYLNPHTDGSDDILFQMDRDTFRLYNNKKDMIEPQKIEPPDEEKGQEFLYEKDLQNFLAQHMSIIEPDLRLYEDEESDKNGLEYPVDGRYIDILALDKNDNFVVIELKVSRGYDRVVGQLLRYKNWIKRNMAENGQDVRGIIICKEITADLLLACDGLDDIELFEYELFLKLHKKEIGV
jgi:RecB family endonuclease NucS